LSLFVEVLAVGRFDPALIDHYEYPAKLYAGARGDAPMVRILFGIMEGSRAGRKFAEHLGIDNVWDFNQHRIDPARIDYGSAEEFLKGLSSWSESDYARDMASLRAFAAAGYDLYLLPNG
jgi:hypothetical protein